MMRLGSQLQLTLFLCDVAVSNHCINSQAACRFHVDDMSSAHVYLRLPKGETMENIPAAILEDCAQLVKANSIQGNKLNNIEIVYTPHTNLKKLPSMEVGQAMLSLMS